MTTVRAKPGVGPLHSFEVMGASGTLHLASEADFEPFRAAISDAVHWAKLGASNGR